VEVSSGEDNVSKIDAPIDKRKAPDGDVVEDGGASSTEPITPNSIKSNVPKQTHPSIADRATSIVPPANGRGHKCLRTAIRQNQPLPLADQVMSQTELPPYRGPRNLLDSVVVEIIFGCLFEAFRRISQVVAAASNQPMIVLGLKRRRASLH
jgi:hypothetical protein